MYIVNWELLRVTRQLWLSSIGILVVDGFRYCSEIHKSRLHYSPVAQRELLLWHKIAAAKKMELFSSSLIGK